MEEKRIPGESLELENDSDEDSFFQWRLVKAYIRLPNGKQHKPYSYGQSNKPAQIEW